MYIARILYPVRVLGPGKRVVKAAVIQSYGSSRKNTEHL